MMEYGTYYLTYNSCQFYHQKLSQAFTFISPILITKEVSR